jgi:hypothetical protein
MDVNSAFKSFYSNRLAVGSVPIAIGIAIFFIASSFTERSDRDRQATQVNLIIREIGHRLLLQAGDSTSRVLPVIEINEGTFLLKFENEFGLSHDSLMMLSQALLPKTQFPSGYTVTVLDCMNTDIVYGFQINNISPDILGCRGRREPPGCYTIEFAFPDFYRNVKDENAETKNLAQTRVDDKKAEQKKADIDQLSEELKSFKADPQDTNPIPPDGYREVIGAKEFKTTTSGYLLVNLVWSGMLVLLSVTLLIGRFGKILKPVPMQSQDPLAINESVAELAVLGKFLFDVKGQRLLSGSEVISLTDKECKVLELLNKNFGELIPRETLMQIWINEGVITGRSLDMFVSKLRKKLSGDPELRITNVHGKGYKLEIPGV